MTLQELADAKEEALRQRVALLPTEAKKAFYTLVTPKLKDPDTYAVLNWLCIAGLHHFYLRKFVHGFINLTLGTVGIIGFIVSIVTAYETGVWIALAMMLVIFCIELPQLFASQRIVQEYNNAMMEEVLTTL